MLRTITLIPAYGRSYSSKGEALKAWIDGKDFKIKEMGCYMSLRDVQTMRKDMYSAYLVGDGYSVKVI